jgi:hypothetical protein
MEIPKLALDLVSIFANLLTICASGIAIYLFVTKRKALQLVVDTLVNWSFQLTLSELKNKLERLNEYNANEPTDVDEIRNILHEIAGQIRGNPRLPASALNFSKRLEQLASGRSIKETSKRSAVSELREILRNIELNAVVQQEESRSE